MLNKRSKYFVSLVFRVKKKKKKSSSDTRTRKATCMADEVGLYTPTVFEFFPAALCFRSVKTAPEMLSMLLSQGDDRRGWMFSSCTFIGWLGWCLSERQALRLATKFGLIQKHRSRHHRRRHHSFPVTGEKKNVKLNAPIDSLLIRHSGVFPGRRQLYLKVTQLPERRAS